MSLNRRDLLKMFGAAAVTMSASSALAKVPERPDAYTGPDRFRGYYEAVALAERAQANYLMLYDTNHQNRAMPTFPLQEGTLNVAKAAGVKHIFLELPRERQRVIDQYASGLMTREAFIDGMTEGGYSLFKMAERSGVYDKASIVMPVNSKIVMVNDVRGTRDYMERLAKGIQLASARGIRVWGADSFDFVDENRLTKHDEKVASYIAAKAGGEKSIITYGMLHGSASPVGGKIKGGGLDDELARRGRVMTVEMEDSNIPDPSTPLGEVLSASRLMLLAQADRSPLRLNIGTGAFFSDPDNKNTFVRGRYVKPRPKSTMTPHSPRGSV